MWFTQRRSLGEPISGPLHCEKALGFNKQLNKPPDFKASSGWLNNLKQRLGIRQVDVQGEMLSGDSGAAELFVKKFEKITLISNWQGMTSTMLIATTQIGAPCPENHLHRNETRAPG